MGGGVMVWVQGYSAGRLQGFGGGSERAKGVAR